MRFVTRGNLIFLFFSFTFLASFAQTKSYKRGVSYQIPYTEDVVSLSKGTSWFYNWGPAPINAVDKVLGENEMDFLPMAWNGKYDEGQIRTYLQSHPNVKYLLAFNEPNFNAQANMSPTEAVAAWPKLQKIADDFNLKLVSPALNFSPDAPYNDPLKWLDEFFELLPSDARVDYVAVHSYMSWPSALMWYIGTFKKYGRPIWLTEFCAWDNFREVPGDQPTNQLQYMVDAINYLESDPDVYRYAWFIPRTGEADKYPYMQLLEDNKPGVLTDLGKVFVNMSSQDPDYYFAVNEKIPAEHYSSMNIKDVPDSDHWKGSIKLCPTTDTEGVLEAYDFGKEKWVEYNLDVPQAGNYTIEFRYAAKEEINYIVSVTGTSRTGDVVLPATGSEKTWADGTMTFSLDAGKQTLRIQSVGANSRLNWLKVSDQNGAGIEEKSAASDVVLYPVPVRNTLHIQSESRIKQLTVSDMAGKAIRTLMVNNNQCELSFLSSGVYLVSMQTEAGEILTQRMIKE